MFTQTKKCSKDSAFLVKHSKCQTVFNVLGNTLHPLSKFSIYNSLLTNNNKNAVL